MGKKRGRPAKIKMDVSKTSVDDVNKAMIDDAAAMDDAVSNITAIDCPDTSDVKLGTYDTEKVTGSKPNIVIDSETDKNAEVSLSCENGSEFTLIANNEVPANFTTINLPDPVSLSCSILGCDPSSIVIAGDKRRSTPNEFFYYQYGVGLSFELDEKTGMYKVLNHRSKYTCNAACYWLIDKLIRETESKIFFSPGREGIVR